MRNLKNEALSYLRELREQNGNCYHGIDSISAFINCDPEDLFDWENDSGVLLELYEEGLVYKIVDSFMAAGSMGWDEMGEIHG